MITCVGCDQEIVDGGWMNGRTQWLGPQGYLCGDYQSLASKGHRPEPVPDLTNLTAVEEWLG